MHWSNMKPQHHIEHRTALLVEDDVLQRMFGADVLEEAGFDVLEAATADEALALIECQVIDALVTDVEMPGSMSGVELACLVRRRFPHIPILITSGGGRPAAQALPPGGRFLAKPYDPEEVSRLLN